MTDQEDQDIVDFSTTVDDDVSTNSYSSKLSRKQKKARQALKEDDEDEDYPQKSAGQLAAQLDDSIQTSMPAMDNVEMISKDEKTLDNGHVVQEIIMESADKSVIKVTESTEGLSQRQAVKDVQKQLDKETEVLKQKIGEDEDVQVKTKITTNALGEVDGTVTILKTADAIAADDGAVSETDGLPEQTAETPQEMVRLNMGLGARGMSNAERYGSVVETEDEDVVSTGRNSIYGNNNRKSAMNIDNDLDDTDVMSGMGSYGSNQIGDNLVKPIKIDADDHEYMMQSHDVGLITRADPSTYHSSFGAHSFKTEAEGQMDDDFLQYNLQNNSHYFTGIGLIFTIILILWIKNVAVVKDNLNLNITKKNKAEQDTVGQGKGQEFKSIDHVDDEEFDSYAMNYKQENNEKKPYEFKNEGYGWDANKNQTF